MKRFLFMALPLSFLLFSCSDSGQNGANNNQQGKETQSSFDKSDPNQVSKRVLGILKQCDNISKEDFKAYLISDQDIHTYFELSSKEMTEINAVQEEQKLKTKLKSVADLSYDCVNKANDAGMEWNDISMNDFSVSKTRFAAGYLYDGVFAFHCNGLDFSMSVKFIRVNEEFEFLSLTNIQKI